MTGKLRNTNPVHIAFRAIDLHRAYREHGLSETVASACAIGELKMELDELERTSSESAPPETWPADERASERSWERGGFAGPAGWEGEING